MASKVAFYTLGCKLNFTESATLGRMFEEQGYERVPFSEVADYYIINTCTVTQVADRKCRQAISKAVRKGGKVIVTGCYAQLNAEDVKTMNGVSMVVGTRDKNKIIQYVEQLDNAVFPSIQSCHIDEVHLFESAFSTSERTRGFLKVQDGCDYHCAYCTVPLARGDSRNTFITELVQQAESMARKGMREVILTGVNIGDFGKSTNETFYDLLKALIKVDGIERYRISSIEPNLLTDPIIQLVANNNKLANHFHIPLQSGNNKILGLMKRRYTRELYASKVKMIRQLMPFASIGSDVIVGFPGESDEDFLDNMNFLKEQDISYLHVFSYSGRKNTPAFSMDNQVEAHVKESRSKILLDLSMQKKTAFYQKNIGKTEHVIFESRLKNNTMKGFSSNYIESEVTANKALYGQSSRVKFLNINSEGIMNIEIL